jgi:hypothetical protein
MPGTSVQEWLEVAAFMYPVIPPAQVRAGALHMQGPAVLVMHCMHVCWQTWRTVQ